MSKSKWTSPPSDDEIFPESERTRAIDNRSFDERKMMFAFLMSQTLGVFEMSFHQGTNVTGNCPALGIKIDESEMIPFTSGEAKKLAIDLRKSVQLDIFKDIRETVLAVAQDIEQQAVLAEGLFIRKNVDK